MQQSIITQIRKRSGDIADFNQDKITTAIEKAAQSAGINDKEIAEKLSNQAVTK